METSKLIMDPPCVRDHVCIYYGVRRFVPFNQLSRKSCARVINALVNSATRCLDVLLSFLLLLASRK